jgi:hypothetical protein
MAFGWLYDYRTREPYRPATLGERNKSAAAVTEDNPLGTFDDDGVPVYVGNGPEAP